LITGSPGSTASWSVATGETEITYLELAIGIDEKITRFKIAMQDIRRMDVFETTKCLVKE
jgi:hypothetical protein